MKETTGCGRVLGRMDRWIDGDLEALEEVLDRGHIEACFSCAQTLAKRRSAIERMRTAARPDPDELREVVAQTLGALKTARPPRARARTWLPVATAAAALLLLFALERAGVRLSDMTARVPQPSIPTLEWSLPDAVLPGSSRGIR